MASIRTFKTFLAVAKYGTFAAAGKEIGLTAAAVGLQVRALEEELGQVLFDRGPRSVVLNTAGRKAVPQIEELLAVYEALADTGDNDELSGKVVMGALVSALMGAFADALWSLKRQHPKLKIQLFAGLSSDFAYQVESGELDAAIATQPPRALPSSVVWTPLYKEPMVMIVPRRPHFELPEAPLDVLRQAPFIRFDRHTWTGHLVKGVLSECGVATRDELELNSVEAMIEIVRQGFGISIVPQLANVEWDKDRSLRVVHLPGVTVQRCVGLLERTRHSRMQFTGAIKAYFSDKAPPARRT
jgi:DNA-binding transcriptional LysR family regulator